MASSRSNVEKIKQHKASNHRHNRQMVTKQLNFLDNSTEDTVL